MKSVSVPYGTAIPGVAGLAVSSTRTNSSKTTNSTDSTDSTNSSSSSDSKSSSGSGSGSGSSSSGETAIGAGVGVPLGAIAIGSLIWALWERRGRMRALAAAGTLHGQGSGQQMAYRVQPVELQGPELELPGSAPTTETGSEGYSKSNRSPLD